MILFGFGSTEVGRRFPHDGVKRECNSNGGDSGQEAKALENVYVEPSSGSLGPRTCECGLGPGELI